MKKTTLTILFVSLYLKSFTQILETKQDTTAIKDTIRIHHVENQKAESFIIPAVFIGYGLVSLAGDNKIRTLDYSTNLELQEDHPTFALKIDNYARYAPVLAVYGLELLGVQPKHKILDRSMMLLSSFALVSISTGTLKSLTARRRPNNSNTHSFPSGHTSLAFMAAEVLNQEYKDQSVWYSVGGYAIATGTGIFRLYNNAHWVSDVVAGAGIGILSTKLIYIVYPYIKRKFFPHQSDLIISPVYAYGRLNFSLTKRF